VDDLALAAQNYDHCQQRLTNKVIFSLQVIKIN
jgi:hypothetical protein